MVSEISGQPIFHIFDQFISITAFVFTSSKYEISKINFNSCVRFGFGGYRALATPSAKVR